MDSQLTETNSLSTVDMVKGSTAVKDCAISSLASPMIEVMFTGAYMSLRSACVPSMTVPHTYSIEPVIPLLPQKLAATIAAHFEHVHLPVRDPLHDIGGPVLLR